MFPFCDSSSPPMDLPLYQQLQLSPPSPKPDHQSTTSFLYYPCSPPFADAGLHLLPYHQQQIIDESPEPPLMEPAPQQVAEELANAHAVAARKDRHSKICTAGGMRDRRMRLSKDVAHKFFALMDLLGYDKPSKTVQWLLNASKSAIQAITADDADSVEDGGSSSLSVVDAAKQQQPLGNGGDQQQHTKPAAAAEGDNKKPNKARKTGPKPARKAGNAHPHPVPDKETRAKARERARERTKEKHRMRWVKLASAIDVEAAAACSSVARDTTNNNHLMKNHHHHPEERCSSSTLNNGGGRMQEITGASDVILGFNGGYVAAAGNYYCQQEQQWDLGGVVFQQNNHQRFY